jgi:mRNA-degrading endonuclease toxin of MazEF toxin-antitoxin module
VDIPTPKPAQVIRYAYLWADEHAAGREEGAKDRPAAIILTLQTGSNLLRVAVVPITHAPPASATDAVEIPAIIKRHLGLDDFPSWIVLDEINVFAWPGPDLRPATGPDADTALFGYLPAGFFRTVRDRVVANIRTGKMRQVPRTE